MEQYIKNTIEALERNNMKVFYAENKSDATNIVFSLISKDDTIASGGSVTLNELGIIDKLNNEGYNYIDRKSAKNNDEMIELFKRSLTVDTYLMSSNAITENGELYNVDGNSNRIAALLYGPKSVIIVAGVNKIVKDIDVAVIRMKTIAAPLNCKRLNKDTYCGKSDKGVCVTIGTNKETCISAGCDSPQKICRNFLVSGKQAFAERIKVILVNEKLGY